MVEEVGDPAMTTSRFSVCFAVSIALYIPTTSVLAPFVALLARLFAYRERLCSTNNSAPVLRNATTPAATALLWETHLCALFHHFTGGNLRGGGGGGCTACGNNPRI